LIFVVPTVSVFKSDDCLNARNQDWYKIWLHDDTSGL
jgi:hypothetical protein